MYDYDKLIDLVVEKRKEKGWYQYDLANAVYMNARIISRIESKRNVVKLDTFLLMLGLYLGLRVSGMWLS